MGNAGAAGFLNCVGWILYGEEVFTVGADGVCQGQTLVQSFRILTGRVSLVVLLAEGGERKQDADCGAGLLEICECKGGPFPA